MKVSLACSNEEEEEDRRSRRTEILSTRDTLIKLLCSYYARKDKNNGWSIEKAGRPCLDRASILPRLHERL